MFEDFTGTFTPAYEPRVAEGHENYSDLPQLSEGYVRSAIIVVVEGDVYVDGFNTYGDAPKLWEHYLSEKYEQALDEMQVDPIFIRVTAQPEIRVKRPRYQNASAETVARLIDFLELISTNSTDRIKWLTGGDNNIITDLEEMKSESN